MGRSSGEERIFKVLQSNLSQSDKLSQTSRKELSADPGLTTFLDALLRANPSAMGKIFDEMIRRCKEQEAFDKDAAKAKEIQKEIAKRKANHDNDDDHRSKKSKTFADDNSSMGDDPASDTDTSTSDGVPGHDKSPRSGQNTARTFTLTPPPEYSRYPPFAPMPSTPGSSTSITPSPGVRTSEDDADSVHQQDTDPSAMESVEDAASIETELLVGNRTIFRRLLLQYFGGTQSLKNPIDEFEDAILPIFEQFQLQKEGAALREYLDSRPEPSPQENFDRPATWELSDPDLLSAAVERLKGTGWEVSLHKAFGQMRLYNKIKAGETSKLVVATSRKRISAKTAAIRTLVSKEGKSFDTKTLQREERQMRANYKAGKRWKETCGAFGGSGAVLIFITAGVAFSKIASKITDQPLEFLQHLAQHLPTITWLVSHLGPDALQSFCINGNLTREIRSAIGTDMDSEDED